MHGRSIVNQFSVNLVKLFVQYPIERKREREKVCGPKGFALINRKEKQK